MRFQKNPISNDFFQNFPRVKFRYDQISHVPCISMEAKVTCFGGYIRHSDYENSIYDTNEVAEYASDRRWKIMFYEFM